MHQHLTVARVAEGLGVAWHTANDAVLAEGKRVLIAHPGQRPRAWRDRVEVVAMGGFDRLHDRCHWRAP